MVQLPDSPWHEWSEARKIAHVELSRAKAEALKVWPGSITSTAWGDFLEAVMESETLAEVEGVVQRLAGG